MTISIACGISLIIEYNRYECNEPDPTEFPEWQWDKQRQYDIALEMELREQMRKKNLTYPNIDPSSGVYEYNGKRYTYYSSNVLSHYLINNGHTDDRGFGRDSNENIVCAYTMDAPFGTLIQLDENTTGAIGDHCETPNTVDIYVSG